MSVDSGSDGGLRREYTEGLELLSRRNRCQASFSPFVVSVVPRVCDTAAGRVADSAGACVCADRTAFDLPFRSCAPLSEVLAYTILAVVASAALTALAWLRWARRRSDLDRVMREAAHLRGRFRLAWRRGFVLRSEWVPFWVPLKDVVVINEGMLEAAARLSLFRSDFDGDLVDGLALCLRDRPENRKCLFDWLLDLSLTLLEPDCPSAPRKSSRGLQGNSGEYGRQLLRRVQPESLAQSNCPPSPELAPAAPSGWSTGIPHLRSTLKSAMQPITQEARYRFFAERVARLQVWRSGEECGTLFDKLRIALQPLVDRLSTQCDARFAELDRDPHGAALRLFGSRFQGSQTTSKEDKVKEVHGQEEAEEDDPEDNDSSFSLYVPTNADHTYLQAGDVCGSGTRPRRPSVGTMLSSPAATMFYPIDHSKSSDSTSSIIDRQDHPKVRAVRPDETDRAEALLQARAASSSVYGHFNSCSIAEHSGEKFVRVHVQVPEVSFELLSKNSPRSVQNLSQHSFLIEEDTFLAQVNTRAKVLNAAFQAAVLRVVEQHRDKSASPALEGAAPLLSEDGTFYVTFECNLGGGEVGSVQVVHYVHSAPIKSVQRMRHKLAEYAPPDPRGVWPLTANILDPVRGTVVCDGARSIVTVAKWFTESCEAGLSVCRIKNTFEMDQVPDGYRDLKIFLLFQDSETGLSIIGEVQINDRQLYDLKCKMHKLYKVRRSPSAAALQDNL